MKEVIVINMNVLLENQLTDQIKEQFILLELDTFDQDGLREPVKAYAVISNENVPVQEFAQLNNMVTLHNTMMLEYHKKNLSFCEQALEHLKGKWSGELDSFYDVFENRVNQYKKVDNWSSIIKVEA